MIRIKVYKLKQVICASVVALLVIAAVIVGVCMFVRNGETGAQETISYAASASADALAAVDKSSRLLSAPSFNLLEDPASLLSAQLPVEPKAVPVTAESEQADEPDDPDRIRVEISRIEGSYGYSLRQDKPRVLIYHTHSYEAYAQDPENPYQETSAWRTEDVAFNIMGGG